MNKVLGRIFSLVGNIGTFLIVLVTLLVIVAGILTSSFNMVLACVLIAFNIVFTIIAHIGNNIEDSNLEGLKLKVILFRLLGWIPNFLGMIIAIVGVFVAILGGIGASDPEMFMGLIPAESVENYGLLVLGIAMLLGGVIWMNLYGVYILHHCKYCGANLKGGDYAYEEIERSAIFGNDDKVRLRSKIRFEFDCPECGETNVIFKTLQTDGEQIDNYARGIVGR